MKINGRSYACGLSNRPLMLASGRGAGFISETPVLTFNLREEIHDKGFPENARANASLDFFIR